MNTNALSLVSLSITPTPSPFSLHSPSTSLYIPLSVRQDPSGIRGPYLVPQHSSLLGRRKNLLHRQVKGTPCSKQRLLQRLKEETDWQKSEGWSIFLYSPLQLLFYHFFFFNPSHHHHHPHLPMADLHVNEEERTKRTESNR